MHALETLNSVLGAIDERRAQRRRFLKVAGGSVAAVGALSALAACGDDGVNSNDSTPFPTPTPTATDADILNFALNLEYLEAQFYIIAATGQRLPASQLTGTGAQGDVTGGRQVTFTDPVVAQYAREIAADEVAHVAFLRRNLGSAAVAQPAINIDGGANGAFTAAARAAGVIASTATFDPYASDEAFLLSAFIFEDVGVTAYKGASPLIASPAYLEAAAGILAAEAYHAGLIRTVLYAKGLTTPALRTQAGQISDARDRLDGASDLDQGITGDATTSNIVPADPTTAVAFSRTPAQVLNIVYLNNAATTMGGFFPNGVNANLNAFRVSGAN